MALRTQSPGGGAMVTRVMTVGILTTPEWTLDGSSGFDVISSRLLNQAHMVLKDVRRQAKPDKFYPFGIWTVGRNVSLHTGFQEP